MIFTLPMNTTAARHRVTDDDPCAWRYDYFEPAVEGEGILHGCRVVMEELPGKTGRFGCCVHGHGFRTEDFSMEEAERIMALIPTDSRSLTLGHLVATAHGSKGETRRYFWKIRGARKMWSGWLSREALMVQLEMMLMEQV